MRKVLGLTLALVLTLAVSAMATEQTDRSILLEDGMKMWVSDTPISGLTAGDQVGATYETTGAQNAGIGYHTVGSADRGTLGNSGTLIDGLQAE